MAHLAAAVDKERKGREDSTLLLDAGDSLAGSGIATVFAGKPMVDIMNAMKYDFITLGNHDFNWSKPELEALLAKAQFQITDSNVFSSDAHSPFLMAPLTNNVVGKKEVNGVKVGIIGLTTPDAYLTENPRNLEGLDITDPREEVKSNIRELKKWGADIVVVLSHLGLDKDRELAQGTEGIDIIFGGHTHEELKEAVKVGGTTIVQAGALGADLGRVDVDFDKVTRKIRSIGYRLIPIRTEEIKPDDKVGTIVGGYMKKAEALLAKPVVELEAPLSRSGHLDSSCGNLVADAMREEMNTDIAFVNSGFLRTDKDRGVLTKGDLLDVLPFNTDVVTMKLKGKDILSILEQSVSSADATREKSKMLQVSGLQVGYDIEAPPGRRLGHVFHDGMPLDPEKEYSVATIEFLARGGLAYNQFKDKPYEDGGINARDLVGFHIFDKGKVAPLTDGRIFLESQPFDDMGFNFAG
jgi:2',3'-cyclic-nucleotide 2'-phosphodiesterase (5'-nucleotidase family)